MLVTILCAFLPSIDWRLVVCLGPLPVLYVCTTRVLHSMCDCAPERSRSIQLPWHSLLLLLVLKHVRDPNIPLQHISHFAFVCKYLSRGNWVCCGYFGDLTSCINTMLFLILSWTSYIKATINKMGGFAACHVITTQSPYLIFHIASLDSRF